jgi:D-ribose pyranose/furanose isomerase RbsD
MTTYNTLKKIIPADQALANQALSRSLRQVKDIFDTDLPEVSAAISVLESNKDLDLINDLTTPIPSAITSFVDTSLATGTGPGNTLTTNDMMGIAAGATVNSELPVVTDVLVQLADLGALAPLTANGGTSSSAVNGVYTLMNYALTGIYSDGGNVANSTTIPNTTYYAGPQTFGNVDLAFSTASTGLIARANAHISNITVTYANLASQANEASNACAQQLVLNVDNCLAAGIDIGNVVNDPANANLIANSVSTALGLASQLHDIGLDVSEGGAAQFFENIANTNTVTGQAVIASMREGRNIAVLNAVGIQLDTQLVDVNANTTVANNLQDAQYTVAQARANIVV